MYRTQRSEWSDECDEINVTVIPAPEPESIAKNTGAIIKVCFLMGPGGPTLRSSLVQDLSRDLFKSWSSSLSIIRFNGQMSFQTTLLHFHPPWRSFRLGGRNEGILGRLLVAFEFISTAGSVWR